MWSFPACPGSGMGRVRLDVIRFPVLPDPPRPLRWVSSEMRGRCNPHWFQGFPLRGKLSSYNQIRNLVSDLKGPRILEPKPSGAGSVR